MQVEDNVEQNADTVEQQVEDHIDTVLADRPQLKTEAEVHQAEAEDPIDEDEHQVPADRIMKIIHCTYMYKGVRKNRTKKVYRKYPNRGRPAGKWQPTQEQIDDVKAQIDSGAKLGKLKTLCELKQYQIDTIRHRL